MLDHDTCQPTADVVAAIESLRPSKQRPLTREECTTPELRLEYIAQWLEAGAPHVGDVAGFNMTRFRQESACGTVCCIAGSAIQWWGQWHPDGMPSGMNGARLIGVSHEAAEKLFFHDHHNPDPAWAARCIRHYQKTGIVDWEATR